MTPEVKPLSVPAEPYAFELKPGRCALLIIDMQRDFLEAGGFGESLGNDVSRLRTVIGPISGAAVRQMMLVATGREAGDCQQGCFGRSMVSHVGYSSFSAPFY